MEWGVLFNGYRVTVWGDERILERAGGDGNETVQLRLGLEPMSQDSNPAKTQIET